jgi:ribosomal protein S18 acetylase RimI-like enzyme
MNITESDGTFRGIRFSAREGVVEIGHAFLYLIRNDLHLQSYGYLEDVWVDEAFRGKGHASTLINQVIARAQKELCYKLVATSRNERENVHALYKRFGFREYGKEFRLSLVS